MWINARTMDGKKSSQVSGISQKTKIEELRVMLEKEFGFPPARQRLFFSGKQLEDGYTLFEYNIKRNDLVQVMFRPACLDEKEPIIEKEEKKPKENTTSNDSFYDRQDEDKENRANYHQQHNTDTLHPIEKASSSMDVMNGIVPRWKVKDLVDGKDLTMGAWFEAIVQKVDVNKTGEIQYHVIFEGYDENEVSQLTNKDIRPRAKTKIPFEELEPGMLVMANYNSDEPKERGFWYDVKVTRKVSKRNAREVYGKLLLGSDESAAEECRIIFSDEIFKIEKSDNNASTSDDSKPEMRKVKPDCDHCRDDPNKKCKECACHACGSKDDPDKTLMCDECDMAYHMACLNPPLTTLPDDDEWFCPLCKNDGSHIVTAGQKLKESKKKAKMASSKSTCTRDWGKGMACVGRSKICTIVPPNHFGPIPGVEVGSCWKFRVQASESGVHRPHVSGIHGRDCDGAYSIVLAGGYEDDVDDGEEFTYTGSGGRDLSGNKRTAEQSMDQTLTRTNRALAKNCDAKLNDKEGAEAKNWKDGKPLRVLRSYKGAKHSKYAPADGVRYDGIYKVVKYWQEKGQSGFKVWRYRMRRDDEIPAPWTKAGKKRIETLGLEMQYPEGYLEAQAKKEADKLAAKNEKKGKRKRLEDEEEGAESSSEGGSQPSKNSPAKKAKTTLDYKVPDDIMKLIDKDTTNQKTWQELIDKPENHKKFLERVEEGFTCICCQEVVCQPVTIECGHSTCKSCLQRAFKAGVVSCPTCRFGLAKDYEMVINQELATVLKTLFPGYEAGR